jgi:amicyanin
MLIVGGIGVVRALGSSTATPAGSPTMMGQHPMGTYGPSGMGGSGGMMGPDGSGGMMGGDTPTAPVQATPATGVTQVAVRNFAYQPANLKVSVGATVIWTNDDSAPHTVTFKNSGNGSALRQQGQAFSYTFTQAGTYDYYCAVHPYMVARVIVAA